MKSRRAATWFWTTSTVLGGRLPRHSPRGESSSWSLSAGAAAAAFYSSSFPLNSRLGRRYLWAQRRQEQRVSEKATWSRTRRLFCSATTGEEDDPPSAEVSTSSCGSVADRTHMTTKDIVSPDMTVETALRQCLDCLNSASIDEPEASVTQLLATVLDLPWETGFRDLQSILDEKSTSAKSCADAAMLSQQRLSSSEASQMNRLLQRRLQHEPIQYLVGQWDFLDYTLAVRAPLLCPRPETEELVQHVLQDLLSSSSSSNHDEAREEWNILDVGCGTGCIGIALADQLMNTQGGRKKLEGARTSRAVKVTAIDVEPIAIRTSRANAARVLGPSWQESYQAHLCSAEDYQVERDSPDGSNKLLDVVVSNPPYIPAADMEQLDPTVKRYESHQALYGGSPDGMQIIRTIVQKLPEWCRVGAICWMEVDPIHPALLQTWLSEQQQQQDVGVVEFVESRCDMFGRDRFVKLRVRENNFNK